MCLIIYWSPMNHRVHLIAVHIKVIVLKIDGIGMCSKCMFAKLLWIKSLLIHLYKSIDWHK